jgi:uncharacterized membrane protein YbhN (UPF0104 family)
MDSPINKRFYKVISLFIKAIILIFSFWYIWQKIKIANNTIGFNNFINDNNKIYLISASLLMFINWGLEALKWQLLIAPVEKISFLKSIRSIFAGITVSIFSPNRVGEFAGRVFFLERAGRIQASIISIIGSMMQLLITIVAGILAYFVLEMYYYDFFQTKQFISSNFLVTLICTILLFAALFGYIYLKRNTTFIRYKKYVYIFKNYTIVKLFSVFGFSLARYVVFSIQYYLILQLFGVNAGITILFSLIAVTFFVTSAIPTFAFTEIAVRSATSVYFFDTICPNPIAIVAASLLLWIINLALPALIGSLFVWKLKFFKD